MSLLIKDCILVHNHKPIRTSVLIEGTRIEGIGKNLVGDVVYDAKGNILLPGMIDPHVHFREPGGSEKETWETGSRAAVSGGVTTVLDMPNTNPSCTTAEDLERKRRFIAGTYVNYGLHLGVTPENARLLHKMRGFCSGKLYMGSTTGNLLVKDEVSLHLALASKRFIMVHAEDSAMMEFFSQKYQDSPEPMHSIPKLHNSLRSNLCAELATSKAITVAKHVGGRLVVAHMSTKEEVDLVRKAKSEEEAYGYKVYAEASPHHLFLTEESVHDNIGKVNPPLRTQEDCDALWQGIRDGTIDVLGSDHAPHLWKDKQQPYFEAPSGISGVETTLPLMLNAVNEGKISLTELQRIGAQNPAHIFGLQGKGYIAVGYDADLVLVDMQEERAITALNFHSKAKFSPFDTKRCKGWPIATFVNGSLTWERRNGEEKFYKPVGKEVRYESAHREDY